MSIKRFGTLTFSMLGLLLAVGVLQAGAASSARSAGDATTLRFVDTHVRLTSVGFDASSTAVAPVGSTEVLTSQLVNYTAQFGKPVGAVVGRLVLDCTFVSTAPDGICSGIAHVSNGFFTFSGNGPFTPTQVRYYAVTGGVGPYANDRGEMTTTIVSLGRQFVLVKLNS